MTDEKKKHSPLVKPVQDVEKVWDKKVHISCWREQYQKVREEMQSESLEDQNLEEVPLEFEKTTGPEEKERRRHPRFYFNLDKDVNIYGHIGPKSFRVHDLSLGGIAFYSNIYFASGSSLLISVLSMMALDIVVKRCTIVPVEGNLLEYEYLVHAEFSESVNGYMVYVLAREIYLNQLKEEKERKEKQKLSGTA